MTPLKPTELFLSRIGDYTETSDGQYLCRCPNYTAHSNGDSSPSFSFRTNDDGTVLMHCHAGCRHQDILRAIGMISGDFYPTRDGKYLEALYDYLNVNGNLVMQVCRYNPKSFLQRHYTEEGLEWTTRGLEPLPYNLPNVMAAQSAGEIIFIVEGEKDADALIKLGYTSTCNAGGAGKWRESHSQYFQADTRVITIPDNDDIGEEHAFSIAESLENRGCLVEILYLPYGKDFSEYIEHCSEDDFRQLVAEVEFNPPHTEESTNTINLESAVDAYVCTNDEWPEPIPFGMQEPPLFPLDALPEVLSDFVLGIAHSTQVPIDVPGMGVLCTMATAIQNRAEVIIKRDWSQIPNLFMLSALPSGNRKSAVFKALTEPIWRFERERVREIESDNQIRKANIERQNRLVENLNKALIRTLANENAPNTDKEQASRQLEAAEAQLRALPDPISFQILADDVTSEALAQWLAEIGTLSIYSAEGGILGTIRGRYSTSNMANVDVFLKGYSNEPFSVKRKGAELISIQEPILSMFLVAQPSILDELLGSEVFRERGLVSRFGMVMPRSMVGNRLLDVPDMPGHVKDRYNQLITEMLDWSYSAFPGRDKYKLELHPDAYKVLLNYMQHLEPRMSIHGDLYFMADWVSKLSGMVARIAAVLHMAKAERCSRIATQISVATFENAIKLGDYFLEHSLQLLKPVSPDSLEAQAMKILDWVKTQNRIEFSKRDCHRGLQAYFNRAEVLDEPLTLLQLHHVIDKAPRQGSSRSTIYRVNPKTFNITVNTATAENPFSGYLKSAVDALWQKESALVEDLIDEHLML